MTTADCGPLYALDIETDTDAPPGPDGTPGGLDPRVGAITSIAIHSTDGTVTFDDRDEGRLLRSLEGWLTDPGTTAGSVVTWNGACFDLPYLADRATRHSVNLPIQLIEAGEARTPKYEALPTHSGGYLARIGRHDHIDIAYAWKTWAEAQQVPWSLKPVAKANGITVIEVDREQVAALTVAERMAYNLSDVVATLGLAVKLGDQLCEHLDRHLIDARRR